ncbi:MAG: hypothetical protein KF830_05140 [Planctomycetes bacterium]|nr:hypothetical protein [Planctomycetota bacterium]
MRRLIPVAIVIPLAAAAVAGQAPPGWQWQPIEGASATAFALRWRHGFDDDAPQECGAALAMAECRLARARRAVPERVQSGVQVADDATVAFVLARPADVAAAVRFCQVLLDDHAAVDDDLAAAAIARAALAADDADWLYPGPVLRGRARRTLLAGPAARGVAGSAAAVQALSPAHLRRLLRAPVAVEGVVVGAVDEAVRLAVAGLRLPTVPATPRPAWRLADHPLPTPVFAPHPRVDGPFVALAFAVPADADLAALAVGVEVARARAARDLPLRRGEAQARAPLVGWSWLHGDPVLMFCRRGANGEDPERPMAELDRLVADLVARAPTEAECDTAIRTLRAESGLGPGPPGLEAEALPGRAVALALAGLRRLHDADATAVTPAAAQRALAAVCAPDRAFRGGLLPLARRR